MNAYKYHETIKEIIKNDTIIRVIKLDNVYSALIIKNDKIHTETQRVNTRLFKNDLKAIKATVGFAQNTLETHIKLGML